MRLCILFVILSLPLAAQAPVLTISDAQRTRTVAPCAYYYEDLRKNSLTNKFLAFR